MNDQSQSKEEVGRFVCVDTSIKDLPKLSTQELEDIGQVANYKVANYKDTVRDVCRKHYENGNEELGNRIWDAFYNNKEATEHIFKAIECLMKKESNEEELYVVNFMMDDFVYLVRGIAAWSATADLADEELEKRYKESDKDGTLSTSTN